MKTIEFTNEELDSIKIFEAEPSVHTKIRLAKKMPTNTTLADIDCGYSITPKEAITNVMSRKEKARFENEKERAKRIIKELEIIANDSLNMIRQLIEAYEQREIKEQREMIFKAKDFINDKLF